MKVSELRLCIDNLVTGYLDSYTVADLWSLTCSIDELGWAQEVGIYREATWRAKVRTGSDLVYLVRIARETNCELRVEFVRKVT